MDRDAAPAPRIVPPSHGFAWMVQSLSLIRLQAGRLVLIGLLMQLILGLSQLPLIGLLIMLSVPGLTAGLLHQRAARVRILLGHRQRPPTPLEIGLLAPSREAAHLLTVIRERLEALELIAPVDELCLIAEELEALEARSQDLFGEGESRSLAWAQHSFH